MRLLKNLKDWWKTRKWDKECEDAWKEEEEYYDNLQLIWGLRSRDDLSQSESVSIHTMNDIDICYDTKKQKYYLGIETIYGFDDWENGPKQYINRLFNELTEWMIESSYDINYQPGPYKVFTEWNCQFDGFDSIEELYAWFKFMRDGFCGDL